MRQMLRVSTGSLLLAATAVALAPSSAGAAVPDVTSTLTIQTYTGTPGLEAIGKLFMAEHPGVKLVFETLTAVTSRGPNVAVLSSSGAPDIGYVEMGNGVYTTLAEHGELVNLSPVYKADNLTRELSTNLQAYTAVGGQQYSVVLDGGLGSFFWYNPQQFASAGVPTPVDHQFASVSQFNSDTAMLKAHGDIPIGIAGGPSVDLGHTVDALLPGAATASQLNAYITNWHKGTKSSVNYTSGPFVQVLQALKSWQTNGWIEPGALSEGDTADESAFADGDTTMMQGNTYEIADFFGAHPLTPAKFPVNWVMEPALRSGAKTPFWDYTGDAAVVPTHAPDKALALEFMQFMGKVANLDTMAVANGLLPIEQNTPPNLSNSYPQVERQMIGLERTVGTAEPWDAVVPPNIGQTFEVPVLQQLIGGQVTVAQAAQQFQNALVELQSGKVKATGP